MADSSIAVTPGSGANVAGQTLDDSNFRQSVVIGDPNTASKVAPVDATKGLAVDLTNTGTNATAIKVDNSAVTQPISNQVVAAVTAAWTSATVLNTALSLSLTGYNAVAVSVNDSGTITGGVVTFEVSDDNGTTWYPWYCFNMVTVQAAPTFFLSSGGNNALQTAVAGFTNFRVRLSTVITGSGTVNIRLQASSASPESFIVFPVLPNQSTLTAGQQGPLIQGAVTTASPTYVTGNTNPLSLTTTGALRSAITGNAGATLDAVITASTAPTDGLATLSVNNTTAPSLTTGQSVAVQSDYQGSIFVKPYRRGQTTSKATTIASSSSATTVLAAQAAGIFADISQFNITTTPAATTPIQFTATLSDGTNSYIYDLDTGVTATPSGQANLICKFNPPLPAASAATAWTVQLSVATVTVHITVVAVLQKAS